MGHFNDKGKALRKMSGVKNGHDALHPLKWENSSVIGAIAGKQVLTPDLLQMAEVVSGRKAGKELELLVEVGMVSKAQLIDDVCEICHLHLLHHSGSGKTTANTQHLLRRQADIFREDSA